MALIKVIEVLAEYITERDGNDTGKERSQSTSANTEPECLEGEEY